MPLTMRQSRRPIYLPRILQELSPPVPAPTAHFVVVSATYYYYFLIHCPYHHSTALNLFFTPNSRARETARRGGDPVGGRK